MKTSEEILKEIQEVIALNKDIKKKCNTVLTDAMSFIIHDAKELQNRLDEEYKHGMNDAWEIAIELCKTGYDECSEIFGDSSVEYAIETYSPTIIKEKIKSYREEKEKIHVGDVVQDNNDNTKATVLDCDADTTIKDERYWMVFTENGCVESWCENSFIKTGESVDVNNILIKK